MASPIIPQINPELDLVLERIVDVPRQLIWDAWTKPQHIIKWFTPTPWTTFDAEVDLRPGGIFKTMMRSPEGQEFPNIGCYLEIIENEKLVWTTAVEPGYRPANQPPGMFLMTAMIVLEAHGAGTKYTAIAMHKDAEDRKKHDLMGFSEGWGKALDQLIAHAKTM